MQETTQEDKIQELEEVIEALKYELLDSRYALKVCLREIEKTLATYNLTWVEAEYKVY
tara:strand:+ start:1355 stop:1528 length:174 start_codon:yes stop_codon:yes gene_type:complete